MTRIAVVEETSRRVVQQWTGGDEQSITTTTGYTQVALADNAPSVIGLKWVGGTTFAPFPPAPLRVVSPLDFARRFTMAEDRAIDALADTDRTVKAWMRRLSLADSVNLDHADVAAGLAYLKSVGIPSVWADAAAADTRIAAIRA